MQDVANWKTYLNLPIDHFTYSQYALLMSLDHKKICESTVPKYGPTRDLVVHRNHVDSISTGLSR